MRLRRRSLRLYVYHNRYQELEEVSRRSKRGFFSILFNICYYTGLTIIYTVISPFLLIRLLWKKLKDDISTSEKQIKTKIQNLVSIRAWRNSLVVFLLLCMTTWGMLHSLLLAAEGNKVKDRVLGDANTAMLSLASASESLKNDNAEEAQKQFGQALQDFGKLQSELESNGLILNMVLKIVPQRQDADKLIQAAQLVTESGIEISQLYDMAKSIKFTPQGIEGGGDNGQNLSVLLEGFYSVSRKVNLIVSLLTEVDANIIPKEKRQLFIDAQSQLVDIKLKLATLTDLVDLGADILLGQKEILVMFQNSNELRPTGGFLGTFGAMKLKNGALTKLHISSIYDLDGQLKELINPPRPLYAVNDLWYLRDSNWFFDFPTSAQKMIDFYEKEGGSTPDIVIALTPNIVIDLLKLTGPITVPGYKTTLTSENFIEMTQLETSVKYDKSKNKPKQFLADFFPLFLQRISQLEGNKGVEVLKTFHQNLMNKEIMLFSNNDELQNKISAFNWAGQVRNTDRDYLAIVSANLGGTKSDMELKHEASLTTEINENGEVINTLNLIRKNTLPAKEGFENKSFIRILVPQGSKLISASGFSPSPLPNTIPAKGSSDEQVTLWESGSVQDIGTGTLIGIENEKTFFGNWLIVNGGEQKSITIKYQLPFKISALDRYSMLFQKQSGVEPYNITHKINHFGRLSKWSSKPMTGSAADMSMYTTSTISDSIYGLVIEK